MVLSRRGGRTCLSCTWDLRFEGALPSSNQRKCAWNGAATQIRPQQSWCAQDLDCIETHRLVERPYWSTVSGVAKRDEDNKTLKTVAHSNKNEQPHTYHRNEAGTRPRTMIAHPHRSTRPQWTHHTVHGKCLTIFNCSIWRNRFQTISLSQYFTLRVEFLLKTESGYLRDAEVTWFTLANP